MVFWVELRKTGQIAKSYIVEVVADQLFFIVGFLILTAVFALATEGSYSKSAQLASLIGYFTWRVAGGAIMGVVKSLADDAQWGTLEQVWLSGRDYGSVLFMRAAVSVLYYTVRVLVIGGVILLILKLPLSLPPGTGLVYLLTLSSAVGLAFVIASLHLVYKKVEAIAFPLATMLLFMTGALSSVQGIPLLFQLSRLLPLSIGIDLLRALVVEQRPFLDLIPTPAFIGLLFNAALYMGVGWYSFRWAKQRTLIDGTLAHY